jgi:hypothetical protein
MEEHLIPYFAAEKQESLLFMLAGVAAVGVSIWLFVTGSRYKGMAYPLIAVAAIQFVVGGTVYFRTDSQVAALQARFQQAPAEFKAEETQRMDVVVKNFKIYKWIEIALLAAGIALAFALRGKDLWYAVGLGLIIQSSLMLVLDLFAEKRAGDYLRFITGL